jgi:hypothetical protein
MAVYERIPYVELTEQEREALHDWCTLHDIVYTTVPVEARIERDETTGDWLVETFDQPNGYSYADAFGNLVRVTLRRPFKAELPWPSRLARSRSEDDEIRESQRKRIGEL